MCPPPEILGGRVPPPPAVYAPARDSWQHSTFLQVITGYYKEYACFAAMCTTNDIRPTTRAWCGTIV